MSTEVSEKLFPDGEFLPDTFRVQMNGYAVKMIPSPPSGPLAHINLLGAEFGFYCERLD
jgi:hypothetical protein